MMAWTVKNVQETLVQSWGQENALEKGIATHSSTLAWESHGQRSLAGYSPWDCKELDTTEQLSLLGSYPILGFRHSSDGRECICNERDLGSTPGWGRSPGEENGNPLQYSCLENPMDRGAWRATVHGVTTEQLTLSHFPREGGWQRMRWLDVITNSWNWVWANSGRQWRTGKPGVLQSMVSQRVGTDLATEQQQGNWLRAQSWDQTMWLCNLPG